MNKKLIRIIALMLVSLMLLFAVACTEPSEGPDEQTSGAEGDQGNTPGGTNAQGGTNKPGATTTAAKTYEPSDLPESLNYENEVCVLFWSDVEMPEFEVDGPSINGVENAIYKRNMQTAEFLGLSALTWVGVPGNHGQKEEFTEHVGNSYNAGDRTYDIIATYSRTAGHCAIEGYLADLESIADTHINLNKPWWPKTLIDTVTIGDAIYFLSGDISTNTLHMMYAMFSNSDMVDELKVEDPVELVINKEWTLEKFMGIVEGVFYEQNGDDKPTEGDRFGFVTASLHVDAFYHGAGMTLIDPDADDMLVISKDFTSNKLTNLISDLSDFCYSTDVRTSGDNEGQFVNENALLTQNRMYYADRKLKNVEFRYACLPTPMYNEKQGGYLTTMANPVTLWGIMKDVENEYDMLVECTAVLECLASEAYRLTTPQIFEVNMKVKYADAENEKTVTCFDLIRGGVVYDLGRIFPNSEMGDYMNELVSRCIVKKLDWSNTRQANIMMLRNNLKKIVAKFEAHQQ